MSCLVGFLPSLILGAPINHLKILFEKLITSRKAMFALIIILFSSIALWFGHLGSNDYVQLTEYMMASYFVGQSAVDACKVLKK